MQPSTDTSSAARLSLGAAWAALGTERSGSVMVEYAILVGAIALGGAVGLVTVGLSVVDSYELVRSLVLAPIP